MPQTESVPQRPVSHVVSRQSVLAPQVPSESERVRPKPQRDSFRNAFTIERMEDRPVSSVVGRVSPPPVASLPSQQPLQPTRQQRQFNSWIVPLTQSPQNETDSSSSQFQSQRAPEVKSLLHLLATLSHPLPLCRRICLIWASFELWLLEE
eukprot:gene29904-37035_t